VPCQVCICSESNGGVAHFLEDNKAEEGKTRGEHSGFIEHFLIDFFKKRLDAH
jgi:hypothetical protein